MKLRIAMVVSLAFITALTGLYFYSKSQAQSDPGRVVVAGVLHTGDTDFDYYRSKVSIVQPIGEVATNFSGSRIAVISGTLVNEGDRKLEAIELKVSLYDRTGRRLRETIKTPVQPNILPHKPLDPLQTRYFSFWVEGISAEWDPRRVDLDVYGLKFAK